MLCYQLGVVLGRSHDTLTHLERGGATVVIETCFLKAKNYVHNNKFDVVININFDGYLMCSDGYSLSH